MGVVLMLDFLKFVEDVGPVVSGIEERDKDVHVEVRDDHVIDALGLNAAMGASEVHLADLLQDVEVFLIVDVFVEEEGDMAWRELVPDGSGKRLSDEAPEHEGACGES